MPSFVAFSSLELCEIKRYFSCAFFAFGASGVQPIYSPKNTRAQRRNAVVFYWGRKKTNFERIGRTFKVAVKKKETLRGTSNARIHTHQ